MKRTSMATLAAVVLIPGLAGCKGASGPGSEAGPGAYRGKPVKVEVFVMSKCPYGVQAIDGILAAADKLGAAVDLRVDYIADDNQDGTFRSMHGPAEVEGDIVQLCAARIAPAAHRKFLGCVNRDWRTIPANTDACAKEAGIDAGALKACKDGAQGKTLLAESVRRAREANANGSPTIKVDGADYRGGRRSDDFLREFCGKLKDPGKPAICLNLPTPPEVQVVALGDRRCKECDPSGIVEQLKGVFPGLKARILDWSDPEAKAIYKDAGIRYLPAVLFDSSVEKDQDGLKQVGRWLAPAGKYRNLRIGAEFDPTAEICDNREDDTGDGRVDCDDPTCAEALACRPEKPGRLDLFVMSQCPYGVKALNAMKEVLDAFGNEMDFGIHYIASREGDGFRALHGQPEVDENIRELCAIRHYSKNRKYMDYILCRNRNIRSPEWKECTGSNGIDTAVIEKCSTGEEGKTLLAEDIKLAEALRIGGSPTWLANNRYTFSGITAEAIRRNFCERNPALKGCSRKLSDEPAGNTQGGCGAN